MAGVGGGRGGGREERVSRMRVGYEFFLSHRFVLLIKPLVAHGIFIYFLERLTLDQRTPGALLSIVDFTGRLRPTQAVVGKARFWATS